MTKKINWKKILKIHQNNPLNENKEKLKEKIQKIFTKLKTSLNDREDELLLEVDQQFNDLFFKEDFIKEGEKLPNKIKISLDALKFIINNQDKGFSYEGIPLDKPLFPIVFLDENGDSIEIIDS